MNRVNIISLFFPLKKDMPPTYQTLPEYLLIKYKNKTDQINQDKPMPIITSDNIIEISKWRVLFFCHKQNSISVLLFQVQHFLTKTTFYISIEMALEDQKCKRWNVKKEHDGKILYLTFLYSIVGAMQSWDIRFILTTTEFLNLT